MFNKQNYTWILAIVSTFLIYSCGGDTTIEPTDSSFESGVLIANEGPFTNGSGTVSHFDRTTKTVKSDIFAAANNGAKIGNILQSVATYLGNTYLMVNNASRVYVVDSKTFVFKDSIKGTPQPRFFEGIDSKKAYISDWANGIAVLDLSSKNITKNIKVGFGADRMLRDGSNVWVLNSGGFQKDSTISIIDVATDAVVKTLKAAPGPNSIVKANASIWVLCGSYYDLNVKGRLLEYKNNVIVNSYEVPKNAAGLTVSKDGNTLYFIADNAVCTKDATNAKAAPSVHISNITPKLNFGGLYSLSIDPKDGTLFCGDAKDFTSNGKVYTFNPTTKVLLDSIKAGIGPNFFSFGN